MITYEIFAEFSEKCSEKNVWPEYQEIFRSFWQNKIMNDSFSALDDSEIDPIVRMLDKNGKGNTKGSIVIAKAFIRMGMWYRAFRSLKENDVLKNKLNEIFYEGDDSKLIKLLNEFEKLNIGKNNGLTGKNAVIINALLCLFNPNYYIFAVSLVHRKKIIEFLYNEVSEYETFGQKIILTNRKIIDYFRNLNIQESTRRISNFIYSIKDQWVKVGSEEIGNEFSDEDIIDIENEEITCSQTFVIEKYLEDFLIGNWESTELGKKYDLIFENEELISQQYRTDIGIIDLLVKEKNSGAYVVIELKKNQTSDSTVGQIMRYIGWVKAKLSPDKGVKGIIIGYSNDEKLNYAISCVNNIEVFLYRINFSLIKPDTSVVTKN